MKTAEVANVGSASLQLQAGDGERPARGPLEGVEELVADRLADERKVERLRIASTIHDVVLQELAAIEIESRIVRSAVAIGQDEAATRAAARVEDAAHRAIDALRSMISGLRDARVEAGGLEAALEQHAVAFSWESGLDVSVHVNDLHDVNADVALLAYECCQEALRNVARHSHAQRAEVAIRRTAGCLLLCVADDGTGIEGSPFDTDERNRFGLALLRDKVELMGGSIVLQGSPGGGTRLLVSLPLQST